MSQNRKNLKMASLALMCSGIAVAGSEIILNVVMSGVYDLPFLVALCVLGVLGVGVGYLGVRAANVPANHMPALIGFGVLAVAGIAVTVYRYLSKGVSDVDDFVGLVFTVVCCFGLFFGLKVRERALR